MLSRAFTKPRRSPRDGETSLRSASIHEYEDFIFGFMEDIPIISFHESENNNNNKNNKSCDCTSESQMTLRMVLRASVGVMGESRLGITEKVVLLGGNICALKRFRKVCVRRSEFGRRIEKLAQLGNECEFLVPVNAYLYAKRIKFVLCHYYPMGSLADLLSGAREEGHTALDWKQRLRIIQSIAKAIQFIHSLHPPKDKHLQINVHGNIKATNIMINIDFTAHLSDYGFAQLAEPIEVNDTGQVSPCTPPERRQYDETLSQKSDMYNFGVVLMDILGWPMVPGEKKNDLFEFSLDIKEQKHAMKVLEIARDCTNSVPDERPPIEQIIYCLWTI
ncbi:putative inactive receptor kinase [Forsythia ovata]|uniref:Inactive receptor kinase n=1 Tax=Forsythia ovata TaxID=205694 RepID=A0ABD1WN52_9LAMI